MIALNKALETLIQGSNIQLVQSDSLHLYVKFKRAFSEKKNQVIVKISILSKSKIKLSKIARSNI